MLKTILTKGRFKVVQNAHGYIVINTHEGYEQHSHFTSIKGCKRCLMFIEKGILPVDAWWQEAVRRLLSPEEFEQLRMKDKQQYYNVNKGVRTHTH